MAVFAILNSRSNDAHADYASVVLGDNAGPYYRLSESGGPTANDSSPRSENAAYDPGVVIYRQPGLIVGDSNTAIAIAGLGGIRRGASAAPRSYSIEGWFKPTGPDGARALIARVNEFNRWVEMVGIQGNGRIEHYVSDGNFERHITSSSVALDGHVYHVVATAEDGGNFRLFVNGTEEGSPQPAGRLAAGDHWQIAAPHEPGWGSFQGIVDEVAFYDFALTPEQVRAHYAAGVNTVYASRALADGAGPYYRLNESSGPSAVDLSSVGEDAHYDPSGVFYRQPGLIFGDPDFAVGVSVLGAIHRDANADPTEYTIEGWFRPSGTPGAQTLIARVDSGNQWVQLVGIQGDGRIQ
ncbi:MAG TPA: LamG domain-containing protein, partial [Candidatus Acidoferrales bacterium]|nr:LamG domain-containing protein [Candidatus Acidoferrales bacterium]